MSYFSEITFETPINTGQDYILKINSNLNWVNNQKCLIHYNDNIWWSAQVINYNVNGTISLKCLESIGCSSNTNNKYNGTIDIYTIRGPMGIRGPGVSYYSDIIGHLDKPNIGDEINLRPRKRQLSWQKGQRILIYTDKTDWIYGSVLNYTNDTIIVLITDMECTTNVLSSLYIDIAGMRGIQGPIGPPCKWTSYGLASYLNPQIFKKNIKTGIKFDTIIQDDLNIFDIQNGHLVCKTDISTFGIKFLTTGFSEGVLFLSLELISRPNQQIIPDIRYNFVKTILPQQPAVCEIFPPIKAFEIGDVFKFYAWFSGTDVDVDVKMMYMYYTT